MKKVFILLTVFLMLCSFCGCRRTIENCADELTESEWVCDAPSGITGKLSFCDDFATLEIIDGISGEGRCIKGIYAIDKESLYITSDEFCKTYRFDYEVYCDRAYISYEENKITFNRVIAASSEDEA